MRSILSRLILLTLVFIGGIFAGVVITQRTSPAPTVLAPTAAQVQARVVALGLLEQRRVARQWTEENAHQLRDLLPQLSPAARDEVTSGVAKLLNAGQLQLTYPGSSLGR